MTACGNDGEVAPIRPEGNITGKAYDAALIGSTIRAYEWDQGGIVSDLIAETVTNEAGDYTLNPSYKDSWLLLEATGGHYIEEASGKRVDLKPGQKLTALVRYESGSAIGLHITTLTHWAACQAEWRAKKKGSNNSDAVGLSYDVFTAMAGVAIREVEPLNITDPNNASPALTAGLQYGMWTAAVSSLTRDMAEQSGQSPHDLSGTTSIHFAKIGCNDLRADGMLDGQGYTNDDTQISQLGFGTVTLTARVYRTELAQHMLSTASSNLNKTGLDALEYLNAAQSLSTMDAAVFNKEPPEPVDLDGPVISVNVPENAYLKGTGNLPFVIDDPLGLSKVEFYIDDLLVDIGSENNTAFTFDTSSYNDGLHTIKVLAYDALNNEGAFSRAYNFDNSGPVVAVTSPTLVNNTNYQASGTYQGEGSDVQSILVNGVTAALDRGNNTWAATVALTAGNNDLVVQAVDDSGNFGPEVTVNVAVDTVYPELRNAVSIVRTSTGQGQLNLCNSGRMDFNNENAICVSDALVSLKGCVGSHLHLPFIILSIYPLISH